MLIHCLSCGKSISSEMHRCPYCISDITESTLELNGIVNSPRFSNGVADRMKELVFGLVSR